MKKAQDGWRLTYSSREYVPSIGGVSRTTEVLLKAKHEKEAIEEACTTWRRLRKSLPRKNAWGMKIEYSDAGLLYRVSI